MTDPTASLLAAGLEAFNAGAFWESHEHLETLWKISAPSERDLFQGLIQLAAAFLKVERAEYRPAVTLFEKAIARLSPYRNRPHGLDVQEIVAIAATSLERLRELGPDQLDRFGSDEFPRLEPDSGASSR
jgi:hypothetical protein